MPKVSVVIPSFNHARFVGEAMRSVLDQTERDLELVVVDDGSTDGSLDVVRRLDDPRLEVVAQPNRGAHAAINEGLGRARGDVLAILNSDDAYHPERLQRALTVLDERPDVGLVASDIEVVDADGRRLGVKHGYRDLEPWPLEHPERSFRAGDDAAAALFTENHLATTSNFVFRRALWVEVGPLRPLRYVHDWDFALRAVARARLHVIPEPLLRYRSHDRNTIRENRAAMVFEICWCLAVHLPRHAAAQAFDRAADAPTRVDQLLHSIHVFGCDRALAVLLARNVSEREDEALALLDPNDPTRARYLEFIERELARTEPRGSPAKAGRPAWLRRLVGG